METEKLLKEIEHARTTATKSTKISLVLALILISIMMILGWIMLTNTTALSKLTKDKIELEKRIEQLEAKIK